MNRPQEVLHIERVSKSFGGLRVLHNISLSLERGDLVGLIGPNGAGKSTLFNIITSLYKPDTGDVYLEGKRVTGRASHKICKMGIARTFQLIKTFPDMTGLENVMVGAVYGQKRSGKQARKRALEALELVEMTEKKDLLAEHMTLSDRRLLEVARAFASKPLVMLLDEPMAGLNATECLKIQQVIKKALDETNMSILWVEHKVDAIFRSSKRVIVIDYGLKIADGEPKEIAHDPNVIKAYLGEAHA